jgi:hypothetical protein
MRRANLGAYRAWSSISESTCKRARLSELGGYASARDSDVEAAKPPGPTEAGAGRFRRRAGVSARMLQPVQAYLHSGNRHARLVPRGVQDHADLKLCEHFPPSRVIRRVPFLGYGEARGH